MRMRNLKVILLIVLLVFSMVSCGEITQPGILEHRSDVEITHCNYDIPEGMEYDEEGDVYYIETEGKALYVSHWASDDEGEVIYFDTFNEEKCRVNEEQIVEMVYGEKIDVEITKFETYEINGLPTYRYDVEYVVDEMEVVYTLIMVGGNEIHSFSYEQNGTREYTDDIERCIKSIEFEYEEV